MLDEQATTVTPHEPSFTGHLSANKRETQASLAGLEIRLQWGANSSHPKIMADFS